MKANGCGDTCVLCCCTPCEIVQEGREIKTCPPAPASEYYFGQGPQQNLIQDQKYDAQPQQGYAPPPPQGYAPPPPQGYAPPPPGYAPPQPGYPQ